MINKNIKLINNKFKNCYLAIIDTETTGLDYEKSKIFQISIKILGSKNILDIYIKHKNFNWDNEALEFHKKHNPNILEEIEKKGVGINEAIKQISLFWKKENIKNPAKLKSNVLFTGYNSSFDFNMLTRSWGDEITNSKMSLIFPNKQLDIYTSIIRPYFKPKVKQKIIKDIKMSTICDFFGFKSNNAFHNSKEDILMLEKIIKKTIGDGYNE